MPNRQSRQNTIACSGHAPVLVAQASESVWQPRFPQVVFFVEALNLSCFNKSGNRKGMWKSIFATSHTDSSACVFLNWILTFARPKPKAQRLKPMLPCTFTHELCLFEIVPKKSLLAFAQVKFMRLRPVFFLMVSLSVAQGWSPQDALLSGPGAIPALEAPLPLPATESSLYTLVTESSPERQISWRQLVPNIVRDQKQIWLFPVSVAHGHHLLPVLAVAGATAGFMAADEHNAKYFRSTQIFAGFNKVFSSSNSALGMEIFPAAFYAIGLARKD